MRLEEIVAPTMKELFITELQKQILSGELKIGERLPSEREMADKTKISRSVVNSALTHLHRLGFVDIVPRQGVFVGDYIKNGTIDTLISIINFNDGKLDRRTFESLISYRTHNECECAYLAAQHRTESDIRNLKELLEKIQQSNDVIEVSELKVEFHRSIYYASGNTIYSLVFNSFKKIVFDFNIMLYSHIGCSQASRDLAEIIQAIEDKDSDKAKSIMRKLADIRIDELNQYYFSN